MVIDKDNIKILLILLIAGLGIGYAYINSDLNINGTAQINSANWDVHFANIQVSSGSVSAPSPTISNQTTINYSVVLDQPGDYYEFTVDAVNGGTIDAMIDGFDSKINGLPITTLPEYLKYTVTYSDGVELESDHELLHDVTEKYKVRIAYADDVEAEDLPDEDQSLSLQFIVTYKQADSNSEEVEHGTIIYTVNYYNSSVEGNNMITVGEEIPATIQQYSTQAEVEDIVGNGLIYLKHKINNNVVIKSWAEFIILEEEVSEYPGMVAGTYSLVASKTIDENSELTGNCKSEYYDSENDICLSPYYEMNKAIVLNAFGSSNCEEEVDGIYCEASNLRASIDFSGGVYVVRNRYAILQNDGKSFMH